MKHEGLRRLLRPLAPLSMLLTLCGCPNTQGEFDSFNERYAEAYPPVEAASCDGGGMVPMPGEADGTYFEALAASLNTAKPFVLLTTVTTTATGETGMEISMEIQPLSAADRRTPVGDAVATGPAPVQTDGTFELLQVVPMDGEANPINGLALEATLVSKGALCATDFICGTVDGDAVVNDALEVNVDGSTFAMTKVGSEADYPEPVPVDCDKTLVPIAD